LERGREAALSAPASAASASNPPFLKLADSRRSFKKKFEPTVFAMIDKSWQLFFVNRQPTAVKRKGKTQKFYLSASGGKNFYNSNGRPGVLKPFRICPKRPLKNPKVISEYN